MFHIQYVKICSLNLNLQLLDITKQLTSAAA